MYKTLAYFIFGFYRLITPLKNLLILVSFGHISQCRHQPTCSQYFLTETKLYGKKGFWRGLKKICQCY